MSALTNVELMLLQLVAEFSPASGYEINKHIVRRGYRAWANIGTTSVYAGLQKLKDKALIRAEEPGAVGKIGKGPPPLRYVPTEAGMKTMRDEIVAGLASSRERDNRFDLGLAGLPFIGDEEAVAALRRRQAYLAAASDGIAREYEAQGGSRLPLHVRALFLHPVSLIGQEQRFIAALIQDILDRQEEIRHEG